MSEIDEALDELVREWIMDEGRPDGPLEIPPDAEPYIERLRLAIHALERQRMPEALAQLEKIVGDDWDAQRAIEMLRSYLADAPEPTSKAIHISDDADNGGFPAIPSNMAAGDCTMTLNEAIEQLEALRRNVGGESAMQVHGIDPDGHIHFIIPRGFVATPDTTETDND